MDITAGGDFLGLCDRKISYKHVSDFGRFRSYGHFFNSRTRPRVNRVYGTSWRVMNSASLVASSRYLDTWEECREGGAS